MEGKEALSTTTFKYDRVHPTDLDAIEEDMSPDDSVRLLFLTMGEEDSPNVVLKNCQSKMKQVYDVSVDSIRNGLLSKWAKKNPDASIWKPMFLESLAAIGRLDVLHILGYDEEEIEILLCPKHLPFGKVAINTISCRLFQKEVEDLVRCVFSKYPHSDSVCDGDNINKLLEVHVLSWMDKGIMNLHDLSALEQALNGIGKDELAKMLRRPEKSDTVPLNRSVSRTYPNKSGLCLIFNQENFGCDNRECDLLWENPDGTYSHQPRDGSVEDANRLRSVFEGFGCRAVIYNNKNSSQMKELLAHHAREESWCALDFLVLCFLSHGDIDGLGRQLIYSSDCQQLLVEDDLARYFEAGYCAKLDNKLKLVITQSCMGGASLPVVRAEADGPIGEAERTQSLYPTTQRDFLFFQAATPGFVAYRYPTEGSLYVRVLCEVLDELGDRDQLLNCMNEVHYRLSQETVDFADSSGQIVKCSLQSQVIHRIRAKFMFVRSAARQ